MDAQRIDAKIAQAVAEFTTNERNAQGARARRANMIETQGRPHHGTWEEDKSWGQRGVQALGGGAAGFFGGIMSGGIAAGGAATMAAAALQMGRWSCCHCDEKGSDFCLGSKDPSTDDLECVVCDEEFYSSSGRATRCPDCRDVDIESHIE